MRGWRAWYADSSTLDSAERDPEDLPPGVVCIMEYLEPPYREIVSGGDWYTWDGERWSHTGTGEWGTWQERPGGVAVRSCERMDPAAYNEVLNLAMEDRRWP